MATAIVLLIVVFMASIWVTHARIIGKSRNRMTSAFVAQQKMEEWIAKGWSKASQDSQVPSLADGQVSITTKLRSIQPVVIPYVYHVRTYEDPDPVRAPVVGVLEVTVKFPDEAADATYKEVRYVTCMSKEAP